MDSVINTDLLGNPLNWIVVGLVLYLWAWIARYSLGRV